MPTYQYTCKCCGVNFEKRLRMSQASQTQCCPQCGGEDTRKRLGAIAVTGTTSTGTVAAAPPSSPFT